MLSTATTALSTSMPTASSRPIIDRMLRLMPRKYMQPSVITKHTGIASDTIAVARQSRRKKNSTSTDSRVPSRPALPSSRNESVTPSAWFCMKKSCRPFISGSREAFSTSSSTRRPTSTRLALRSRLISSATAGRWSRRRS